MAIVVSLFVLQLLSCLSPSSCHAKPPLSLDSHLYKSHERGTADGELMIKRNRSRKKTKNPLLNSADYKENEEDCEQITTHPALAMIECFKEQQEQQRKGKGFVVTGILQQQHPYIAEAETASTHRHWQQKEQHHHHHQAADVSRSGRGSRGFRAEEVAPPLYDGESEDNVIIPSPSPPPRHRGTIKAQDYHDHVDNKENNKKRIIKTTTLQYNNQIRQLAENGNWTKALITWSHMRRTSVRPDLHTFKYILTALARAGQVRKASQIFESMESSSSSGIHRTTVVYNVMLSAHAHAHTWEQALNLLHEFQRDKHFQPDVVSYTTVMCAMTRANQSLQAIQIFNKMKKEGMATNNTVLKPNTLAYNTLKKYWMKSLRAFARMRKDKVPRDLTTYTRLMSISEEAAQWRFAMDILHAMYDSHEGTANDVNPTVRIFNSAISACGKARRMDLVVSLMRKMENECLRPDGYTYRQFQQTQRRVVYGSSRVSKRRNTSRLTERHTSHKMMDRRRCSTISDNLFA
mmetsp:Transcript_6790/g.10708  ORF Transcript_6790/g.10708 Transcript_6790/m.10708 type:complete len:519 (-) Transcript_6790:128-1684(-)